MVVHSFKITFCERAMLDQKSFSDLCFEFGISRQTGYKWLKRYKAAGEAALMDRSRKPHRIHNETPKSVVELVLAIRKLHPNYGARSILAKSESEHPELAVPSLSTINKLIRLSEIQSGKSKES